MYEALIAAGQAGKVAIQLHAQSKIIMSTDDREWAPRITQTVHLV